MTSGPFSWWYFLLLKQRFFWYYFSRQVMVLCYVAQKAPSAAQLRRHKSLLKRQVTKFICKCWSISMLQDLDPDLHSQYGSLSRSRTAKWMIADIPIYEYFYAEAYPDPGMHYLKLYNNLMICLWQDFRWHWRHGYEVRREAQEDSRVVLWPRTSGTGGCATPSIFRYMPIISHTCQKTYRDLYQC